MRKKLILGCGIPLVLITVIGVITARTLLKPKPKEERSETVGRGDVEIKVTETGTIEPLRKVEVKSKVGGRVDRLLVDEGTMVQKGQVLAKIDPQEINTQVAALRAQLMGAQARLAQANKGTTYQKAQTATGIDQFVQAVESARARLLSAEAEAKVQPQLTQQTIDIAQANLDAAQSNLRALQDSLSLMRESTHPQAVVSAQAAYDRARAQARNDQKNLERQRDLLKQGFVSQQAVDASETQLQVSDAAVREAKERLDRIPRTNALEEANARSQIASAQSQAHQMESALLQARTGVLPITKQRDLENARAAYQQARAQLASARSSKTQDLMRGDDVLSADASVRQIQNQLDQLLIQQNDTTLVASMTGMITKRYVEQGELITSAIATFSSGSPIFQISDLATMLIKININEVDIEKLKTGLPTEVTVDASRGVLFNGRVRKIAPATLTAASESSSGSGGSGGNTSSTQTVIRFPVEIQVDHADPRLKPGMSAHCTIVVARRKNVLRVPVNCVTGTGGKATVQIVTTTLKDGQKVETTSPREVTVGLRGDDFVEILSGLQAGEKLRPNPYTGPKRKTIEMQGGP